MTDVTLEGPPPSALTDPAQAQQAVEALKGRATAAPTRSASSPETLRRRPPRPAPPKTMAKSAPGKPHQARSRRRHGGRRAASPPCSAASCGSASVLTGVIPGIGPIIAGGTLAVLLTTTGRRSRGRQSRRDPPGHRPHRRRRPLLRTRTPRRPNDHHRPGRRHGRRPGDPDPPRRATIGSRIGCRRVFSRRFSARRSPLHRG